MRVPILALLLCLTGCAGILTWGTVYTVQGPNNSELRVQEKCSIADCAVRVVVKHGWSTEVIARSDDCFINFAHAEWSGSTVAAFIDGGWCGTIKAAYDTESNRAVDFASAEPWLKASIVKAYSVTPEELKTEKDVLTWATYPGDGRERRSKTEFTRRYRKP